MIPKLLLQTSRRAIPEYVLKQMRSWLSDDWEHITFTNEQMVEYFSQNKIEGFENITNKFHSMQYGQHKSDLFRYYWLWLNGGIHLDSDIMLNVPIDHFVKNYTFVSVHGVIDNFVCNGILGVTPRHPIIWKALVDAYTVDVKDLVGDIGYGYFCQNLGIFVRDQKDDLGIKLYRERPSTTEGVYETYDENNTVLLYHYQETKIIPPINNQ